MNIAEYNFNRCKLCGEIAAKPTYSLGNATICVCRNCDFHFLNHLDCLSGPLENSTPLNEKSRKYIELRLEESTLLHPGRVGLIRKHINIATSKALDIGAGLGQFQLSLTAEGAESEGIEPSRLRREYARERFGVHLREELVENDYWQTGFPEHFDLVTLWDVIEHVDFPLETLRNAVRLLKPGGTLFLDTPARETMAYKLSQDFYHLSRGRTCLFLPNFYSTAPFGHKQIFTCRQLTGTLEMFGLEILVNKHSYTSGLFRGNRIILAGRKATSA